MNCEIAAIGESFDEIPIGALRNLEVLRLAMNKIGNEGMKSFTAAIGSGPHGD